METYQYHEPKQYPSYLFPWTVRSYVDDEGDTIVEFVDAPPNLHLVAHGDDLGEALFHLNEVYKLYLEEIADAPSAQPADEEGAKS